MKAAVFDSGIGGLTVVKSLLNDKIFKQIIYFGDTARVPYGVKDKNTIIRYSLEALEFFKNFDIDILIVACNSVSAYALEELKKHTTIPVVGVIQSGVKALEYHSLDKKSNILVLGTRATIESKQYQKALKKQGYKNINSIATSLFVPLVEENILEGEILQSTFRYYFKDLKDIDVVILGCTHFPLIQKQISKFLDGAITIHSGDAIVEHLRLNYNCKKEYKKTDIKFFASQNPDELKQIAKQWLGDII